MDHSRRIIGEVTIISEITEVTEIESDANGELYSLSPFLHIPVSLSIS